MDKKLWVYLDDERKKPSDFDVIVRTVEEAIALIEADQVEFISLDNDLGSGYTEGYKVADYIEDLYFTTGRLTCFRPHTNNPSAFERMMQVKRKMYNHFLENGGERKSLVGH
jgi:hypothetical protein